tara:strand:+ start:184 stop:876 length:693 start_codon:yes stop_codon:yes gene_type:complete
MIDDTKYRYGHAFLQAVLQAAEMFQTNWTILSRNDQWLHQMQNILKASFRETAPEVLLKAAAHVVSTSCREFPPPAGILVKEMRTHMGRAKSKTPAYHHCDQCKGGLRLIAFWRRDQRGDCAKHEIYAACNCEAGRKKRSLGVRGIELALEEVENLDQLLGPVWHQRSTEEDSHPLSMHTCPDHEWWNKNFRERKSKPLAKVLSVVTKEMIEQIEERNAAHAEYQSSRGY